jgi:hypothetical protein
MNARRRYRPEPIAKRPGAEPGASRLAQAIRAAGYSHDQLRLELEGRYNGCVSAWCTGRREMPLWIRDDVARLIGWTREQLDTFCQEVRSGPLAAGDGVL